MIDALEALLMGLKHETISHGQARDMAMRLRPAMQVAEMLRRASLSVKRGADTNLVFLDVELDDAEVQDLLYFLSGEQ